VFALFFTSVAVSVQAGEENWKHDIHSTSDLYAIAPIHPLECPQQDHSQQQTNHHCCASICLLKMPCAQSMGTHYLPLSSLALIGQDENHKAIARVQTLFRPPIIAS
tara:strand:+ start:1362 stop:1682 length:321 start_codon:yes stop_codon:yes gene_type:complete